MNNFNEILKNKKIILIIICMIALIAIGIFLWCKQDLYNNSESINVLESMEKEVLENQNKEDTNIEANEITEDKDEKIAIHITGEVNKKGILYLKKGSRIADAIYAAGGETKKANLDKVNLAYVLEDGQKIYIPNKNEKIKAEEYIINNSGDNVLVEEGKGINNVSENQNTKGANEKVNINSANQTELETLPGVGPSLAQKIIEHREENGNFKKIEDIQNVKGIGDKKYSNIKEKICI